MLNQKRKIILVLAILIVVAVLIFVFLKVLGGDIDEQPLLSESTGKDLTEFTTETLAGKTVDQTIFEENEVTMVNFWATFCGPCIQEMPDLGEIYREREDSGFSIVGIVTDVQNSDFSVIDDQVTEAHMIVKETGADYPQLMLSQSIVDDMMTSYQINSIPTTFFVDSSGEVMAGPYIGSKSKADWEKVIESVMK